MEKLKTCFKCGRELPISQFYKHPQTSDGHLNKCMECAKMDTKRNADKHKRCGYIKKDTKRCAKCGIIKPIEEFGVHSSSPDGHACRCYDCSRIDESERYYRNIQSDTFVIKERARGREKYRRLGYVNKQTDAKKEKEARFPKLRNARRDFGVLLPDSYELHHWNYNDNDNLIALDIKLHHRVHSYMVFDIEHGYYYAGKTPLDSLEKHLCFIRFICDKHGFDFSSVRVVRK